MTQARSRRLSSNPRYEHQARTLAKHFLKEACEAVGGPAAFAEVIRAALGYDVSPGTIQAWKRGYALPHFDVGLLAVHLTNGDAETAMEEPAAAAEWLRASHSVSATWPGLTAERYEDFGSDGLLQESQASIRHISREYLAAEPLRVRNEALRLRSAVFDVLQEHQVSDRVRDWYVTAGYISALLAWMSGDLGYFREAEAHGATAWLCAELAGHEGLRAWALVAQSKTAFWQGRYSDAASLAQRGMQTVAPGTAGVMLACREASAWAQLGAIDEAMAALRKAQVAEEHIDSDDDVGGLLSCRHGRYGNYAAVVLVRLGRQEHAIEVAEHALSGFAGGEQRHYGTEAQTRISLAAARLITGEPEAARDALAPVLAIPPSQRLDTLVRRVWRLLALCSQPSHSRSIEFRELRHAIQAFCAGSEYLTVGLDAATHPHVVA